MFNIPLSKEFEEFVKQEFSEYKMSFYEKLCRFAGDYIAISPPKDLSKKYQEAINFCHMKTTPERAFSLVIFFGVVLALIFAALTFFKFLTSFLTIVFVIISLGAVYYLYNYPFYTATSYRIKANSEMMLTIIYMSVAMKVRPNLENAVKFTSENLSGPLSTDLKELIWGVYSGKYVSIAEALDSFIEKWKRENEEFTNSINLIKNSFFEDQSRRAKALDEAVSLVLEGSKDRMKHYAQELNSSLTILNALGILLPIIGMVFFPVVTIFMTESIKPLSIIIGYDIILPLVVFLIVRTSLLKRPYNFHQPDLSMNPQLSKSSFFGIETLLSLLVALAIAGYGFHNIYTSRETFNFQLLLDSLLVTIGISAGIITYCLLSSLPKLKLRNDIFQMESEIGVALFQLGYQIRGGTTIESTLDKSISKIKDLKISNMFSAISRNIRLFGATFSSAVFSANNGAIYEYPSRLINAIMKAIVEISSTGTVFLSDSMISISNYLKNMHTVEEYLREMLAEISSTMKTQALILAPLAAGVVVSLAAIIMNILITLKGWMESFQSQLSSYGPMGSLGGGMLDSMINIGKIIPVQYFQLIIGIYVIEIVIMIAMFLNIIENGEDPVMKKYNIGKMLLIGVILYSFTVVFVYSFLSALMPLLVLPT